MLSIKESYQVEPPDVLCIAQTYLIFLLFNRDKIVTKIESIEQLWHFLFIQRCIVQNNHKMIIYAYYYIQDLKNSKLYLWQFIAVLL